jgi:hypothetical protein
MKPSDWTGLNDQVFVGDCGFTSDEPDYWQDHAEDCLKARNPYEVCWRKHQQQSHYTPDGSYGSAFGCDCKHFVKNDERRDGT